MFNKYFVYILASKRNGTLYIGVTNNLERRINRHKNNIVKGFTSKYSVHQLVYYEETNDIYAALRTAVRSRSTYSTAPVTHHKCGRCYAAGVHRLIKCRRYYAIYRHPSRITDRIRCTHLRRPCVGTYSVIK